MTLCFEADPPWPGDDDEEPVLTARFTEYFVAAGILVAEGIAPPMPASAKGNGWPLIPWARRHVSEATFQAAIARGRDMPPYERGRTLRKAIDGDTDA